MRSSDIILGHVCVERGWLEREELIDCLKECGVVSPDPAVLDSTSSLYSVLVRRRLIPEDELDILRAEISKVLGRGTDSTLDREEDLMLGQFQRFLSKGKSVPVAAPGIQRGGTVGCVP